MNLNVSYRTMLTAARDFMPGSKPILDLKTGLGFDGAHESQGPCSVDHRKRTVRDPATKDATRPLNPTSRIGSSTRVRSQRNRWKVRGLSGCCIMCVLRARYIDNLASAYPAGLFRFDYIMALGI